MNTPKTNEAALASNIKMVNHKFCLVMGKDVNSVELANNVMGWVKDIVEFIKPQNTLTSPEELFEMLNLTKKGHITATDLADYLVKNLKYPFRKSYQITAKIVNYCEKNKKNLSDLTLKELKAIEPNIKEDVIKVFDLKNSVNSKKSYGGTSFENIKKMIKKYKNA